MGKKGLLFSGWRKGFFLLCLVSLLGTSLLGGDYRTIFQLRRDLEKVTPTKDINFLLKVGNACLEYGLYLEAEIIFFKIIDLEPDSPDGYRMLYQTFCLQGAGRTQQAMRARARADLLSQILALTRSKQ